MIPLWHPCLLSSPAQGLIQQQGRAASAFAVILTFRYALPTHFIPCFPFLSNRHVQLSPQTSSSAPINVNTEWDISCVLYPPQITIWEDRELENTKSTQQKSECWRLRNRVFWQSHYLSPLGRCSPQVRIPQAGHSKQSPTWLSPCLPSMLFFGHSFFTQQTCIKYLLCARHYAGHWR